MVLINRKVDYAILALCHLMRTPGGCSARELSACYNLSRPFLANILKELCHHGFIESQRGIHGGYKLAKEPSRITVDGIISALDGPFQLMSCVQEGETCEVADLCPVKGPLRLVHDRLAAVLAQTTLEDLGAAENCLVSLPREIAEDGPVTNLPG